MDDVATAGVWQLRRAVVRNVDGTEQLISGAPHLPAVSAVMHVIHAPIQ